MLGHPNYGSPKALNCLFTKLPRHERWFRIQEVVRMASNIIAITNGSWTCTPLARWQHESLVLPSAFRCCTSAKTNLQTRTIKVPFKLWALLKMGIWSAGRLHPGHTPTYAAALKTLGRRDWRKAVAWLDYQGQHIAWQLWNAKIGNVNKRVNQGRYINRFILNRSNPAKEYGLCTYWQSSKRTQILTWRVFKTSKGLVSLCPSTPGFLRIWKSSAVWARWSSRPR